MQVKDVMSRQIVSIGPEAPVLDAVQLMLQHRISGLPVIDASGNLQGVVTEGDFLRRAETGTQRKRARWIEFLMGPGRLASEYVRASGGKVGEVGGKITDRQAALASTMRAASSTAARVAPILATPWPAMS